MGLLLVQKMFEKVLGGGGGGGGSGLMSYLNVWFVYFCQIFVKHCSYRASVCES